jgi:hypothetical protein
VVGRVGLRGAVVGPGVDPGRYRDVVGVQAVGDLTVADDEIAVGGLRAVPGEQQPRVARRRRRDGQAVGRDHAGVVVEDHGDPLLDVRRDPDGVSAVDVVPGAHVDEVRGVVALEDPDPVVVALRHRDAEGAVVAVGVPELFLGRVQDGRPATGRGCRWRGGR